MKKRTRVGRRSTGRSRTSGGRPPVACADVLKKICSDLGRELDSPECRPVREHIRTCPECSAWLDSMEKTVQLFRDYPTPPHRKLRPR